MRLITILVLLTIAPWAQARLADDLSNHPQAELLRLCYKGSAIDTFVNKIREIDVSAITNQAIQKLVDHADCQPGTFQRLQDFRNTKLTLFRQNKHTYFDLLVQQGPTYTHQKIRELIDDYKAFEQKMDLLELGTNYHQLVREMEQTVIQGAQKELELLRDEINSTTPFTDPTPLFDRYDLIAKSIEAPTIEPLERTSGISRGQNAATIRKNNCSSIENFNDAVKKEAPRNQYDSGLCYAYTAADLISHKLNQRVSAIDISNHYNRKWFDHEQIESEMHGGYINKAIAKTRRHGFCSEGILLENAHTPLKYYYTDKEASLANHDQLQKELEEIKQSENPDRRRIKELETQLTISTEIDSIDTIRFFEATLENCHDCSTNDLKNLLEFLPNINLDQLQKVLKRANEYNVVDRAIDDLLCTQRIFLPRKTKVVNYPKNSTSWNQIDSLLESGDIIGFSYKTDILYNHRTTFPLHPSEEDENKKEKSRHASSIVGRRFNTEKNVCEYLVRNSYGKDSCNQYDKSYDCTSGHIWIAQPYLDRALLGITYLENTN